MPNDCAFIHDGYTRPGFIAPIAGLFPAIRFTFRPMLTQDRSILTDRLAKAKPEMADRISAEAVAARISEWDVTDSHDELVPINTANVLRLQPSALGRLFAIVTGTLAERPAACHQSEDGSSGEGNPGDSPVSGIAAGTVESV